MACVWRTTGVCGSTCNVKAGIGDELCALHGVRNFAGCAWHVHAAYHEKQTVWVWSQMLAHQLLLSWLNCVTQLREKWTLMMFEVGNGWSLGQCLWRWLVAVEAVHGCQFALELECAVGQG